MNRIISGIAVLFIGIFTVLFTVILAIPLTILALLTGNKLKKSLKMHRPPFNYSAQERVLEGEYEEVKK